MKKIKKLQIYRFIIILLIVCFTSLFIFSNKLNKDEYDYKYLQDKYKIVTFTLPDTIYFAGQLVDLTNPYIRERVETELYSITYFHSLLIKTIKQADRYLPYIEKELKKLLGDAYQRFYDFNIGNFNNYTFKYIEVKKNNTVPFSHDFGYTYI